FSATGFIRLALCCRWCGLTRIGASVMWIRKALRDHRKGVDTPMPTQAVSNEEFIPRPQSEPQQQVEHLIGEMSETRAKKLGLDRRAFMASTMGLATCFLAQN